MKKKIILSSVLSIVICVCLIAGATFALFTSEARVNVSITSGNVKLTATLTGLATESLGKPMPYGEFELGGKATLEGSTLRLTKMVPGDKATVTIDVDNASDVPVAYCVKVVGVGELVPALTATATVEGVDYAISSVENTTDWINVPAGAQINDIAVSVLMPHTVGNEYQGKTADLSIQIVAIQGNAASGIYVEGTQYEDITSAINDAIAANVPVQISGTVELPGSAVSNEVVDLKGVTFEGLDYATLVFVNAQGSTVTGTNTFANFNLKNIAVADKTFYAAENGENAWEHTYLELAGDNLYENVVFTDGILLEGGNARFVDCTFVGHNNDSSDLGNATMYAVWVNNGSATFTRCNFYGTRGLKACDMYDGSDVTSVVVDNCVFGPLSEKPGIALDNRHGTLDITIKDSRFAGTQAGDQGNYIYENDDNVNTHITLTNNTVDPIA